MSELVEDVEELDVVQVVAQAPTPHECPHCSDKADIILESCEGEQFATHRRNLGRYSEAFPPASFIEEDESVPVVRIEEDKDVILLLLQYMHLVPQPDLDKVSFGTLEKLSNAVEKYLVYGAMPICKVYMGNHAGIFPIQVLRYATKHGYGMLADEAVTHTLGFTFNQMKAVFDRGSHTPYIWLEYKEQYTTILNGLYNTEPPVSNIHKGGLMECSLWKPFYWDVLHRVGRSPANLKRFDAILKAETDSQLSTCPYCTNRSRQWGYTVKLENIQPFSTFM